MRTLTLIPLALLTAACWTPGPGQIDPTRYPWDQPRAQPSPKPLSPTPQEGTYCVVALELSSTSGIIFGGESAAQMACDPPSPTPPPLPPSAAGPSTPLGPTYVMREIGNGFAIRTKLSDLTPEERAEYEAKASNYTFTADAPVLAAPPSMTASPTAAPSGERQDQYIDITCHPRPRPPGPSGSRC